MRFQHVFHLPNNGMIENTWRMWDREMRELWRELARLITLFDQCSPAHSSSGRNRRILRKWRARQDSHPFASSEARRDVTEDCPAQLPRTARKRARQDSNLRPPA